MNADTIEIERFLKEFDPNIYFSSVEHFLSFLYSEGENIMELKKAKDDREVRKKRV